MTYQIPPINTKGVFIFHAPFSDDPNINKKEYEVVEIRKLKTLHDAGEDPLTMIYLNQNLTQEDFIEDLENEIPIVTLTVDDEEYLYIPADRIKEIPAINGHTATERLLTFSLGIVPDEIDLTLLYENLADYIEDTISVRPAVIEQPGGPTVVMDNEQFNNYIQMMKSKQRSNNKSWRVRYKELEEQTRELQLVKEQIEKVLQRFLSSNPRTV